MTMQEKVTFLILIIVVGFFVAVADHYVMGHYFGKPWPANTFLFRPWDRFYDFTLVVRQSAALDPFGEDNGGFAGAPFPHLLGYLFSLLAPPLLRLLVFFGAFFAAFTCMIRHHLRDPRLPSSLMWLAIFVVVFMTYPVLFAVDRANFDLLVLPLVFVFALTYAKRQYRSSALALGLAIALKPHALLLIVIYIFDRRYRHCLLAVLIAAFLYALSLALFKDGLFAETHKYVDALSSLGSHLSAGSQQFYTSDIYGLLTVVIDFVGNALNLAAPLYLPDHPNVTLAYAILASLVGFYFLLHLWVRPQPLWKTLAVLITLTILLPFNSHDYRLILLFVPMLMFLAVSEKARNDTIIVALWGLLLIPKNYYPLNSLHQNIGMLVNPLLLIALLICLIPSAFSTQGPVSTLRLALAKSRSLGRHEGYGRPRPKLI
jgi:hypothetical protein